MPILIYCGKSKDEDYTLLDCGDSTTEGEVIINGGDSIKNPREYITVTDSGIVTLTNDGRPIEIGDKVIMSIEPNKVTSNMFDNFDRREWYYARPIGKVVRILEDNKVEVLLDIE